MKQQQKQVGITAFYSYAEVDRALRDQLADHLSQLERDGLIQEWPDQQIIGRPEYVQLMPSCTVRNSTHMDQPDQSVSYLWGLAHIPMGELPAAQGGAF